MYTLGMEDHQGREDEANGGLTLRGEKKMSRWSGAASGLSL